MPYKDAKHRTRRQRQQRRAGHVRRVEVVLSAESEQDHEINAYLDGLPHGEVSAFIRAAIVEKMHREQHTSPPENPSAAAQFNAILAELAALRAVVSQPAPVAATVTPQEQTLPAPEPPPALPESPGTTVSSGLDMSRPRPRKRPGKRPPTPPPTLPELDEPPFDAEASRRLLVESIKAFGKNRDGS